MATEKGVFAGNAAMLVMRLLETEDMYGYRIIKDLAKTSGDLFKLKTGALYPLLHGLESEGMVTSYIANANGRRVRKYYKLTPKGKAVLAQKKQEWREYSAAVDRVMGGGHVHAAA